MWQICLKALWINQIEGILGGINFKIDTLSSTNELEKEVKTKARFFFSHSS